MRTDESDGGADASSHAVQKKYRPAQPRTGLGEMIFPDSHIHDENIDVRGCARDAIDE